MNDHVTAQNINLSRDWNSVNNTYAIGSGFLDESYHNSKDIAQIFSEISNISDIELTLREINGFFSIITDVDDRLLMIVDRIASFPLFYMEKGEQFYISDDPSWLHRRSDMEYYDEIAELEYLLSGYITGRNILSPNIFQLLAGERVLVPSSHHDCDVNRKHWYKFPTTNKKITRERKLLQQIDDILTNVYRRLIEYADGRPIVVSLSSGHDSRLNLIMLSKLGYDNIIALTHDDRSGESELCKNIVEDFGVPWVYISRTHRHWYQWYNSPDYRDFQSQSRYLDRIPTLEGAFSVKTAKEQDLIPTNSIFVTGDGVISTGEHIPHKLIRNKSVSNDELIDIIVNSHYKYWKCDDDIDEILHERVSERLNDLTIHSSADAIQIMEQWDWQERQAKFIPRTHIFEFWDYDWWMPLWDREFVEFWSRLPIEYKFNKQLFRDYVEELHAEVADVDDARVQKTIWKGRNFGQTVKHKLRNSRFDPVGTKYEKLARKIYYNMANPVTYEDDPMFGIMKKQQFEGLRTGLSPIIHRFQALEVLGRVSFDPPKAIDMPEGDTITIDDI